MFSWFKKKKAAYPKESKWSGLTGEAGGKPMIVRRNDSAKQLAGCSDFKHRLGVAIPLRAPNEHGLPSESESAQLYKIEDVLVPGMEAGEHSILVLAITVGGMREFVFYTRDPVSAETAARSLQATISSHEIQSYVAEDPEWEVYKTFSHNKFPPAS